MKQHKINNPTMNHSFIKGWLMDDVTLCDNIINFFESNKTKQKIGESYTGLNKEVKDSIDLSINPLELESDEFNPIKEYMSHLNDCYCDYMESFNLNVYIKELHIGPFNIQKYNKGGHFKSWHSERMNISSSSRLFAWMTYLNDVEDGGETEFYYYGVKVKPKKGLTIIWPSEWTHLHKGSITNEIKYVITGWLHFPDNMTGV